MRKITKEIFLNSIVCPTLGWMLRNPAKDEKKDLDTAARFRMEQGIEVGRRARNPCPGGNLVREMDSDRAALKTRELLQDDSISIIFEGTFNYGNYVARADILKRLDDGWHILEVKSSVNDDEKHVDDLSYTVMVCQRAGLDIKRASLMLISKDYRLGMADSELFKEIDHTADAINRAGEFSAHFERMDKITGQASKPESEILFDCRKCGLFTECVGQGIKNHIFELPRLSQGKFDTLKDMGIFSIADIPKGFGLTTNQRKVYSGVITNAPILSDDFNDLVNSVHWPAFYLDFETAMTAIPLYPEIAPFTQIPTQYSIDKCSDFGKVEKHFEYLADPSRDCRKELALNLIEYLEGSGSIVAYSSFEKTTIKGLIGLFPDLEHELSALY